MGILRLKVEFDKPNGKLHFYDLVEDEYHDTHGYTLSNIKGLIKVVGAKTGVVYQNPGWSADNFSSPDITYADWKADIAISLAADGTIPLQNYLIYYKVSFDGLVRGEMLSKSFLNGFVSPSVKYSTSISIANSTLYIKDTTDYSVTFNNVTYTPETTTKNIKVKWPTSSGNEDDTMINNDITLGPNIWTGHYNIELICSSTYILYNTWEFVVYFLDKIENSSYISVLADSFDEQVDIALLTLTDEYEYQKIHDVSMANYWRNVIDELMMYYDIHKLTDKFGNESGIAARRIWEILTDDANDLLTGVEIEEKEIYPWSPPTVTGDVAVPGGIIFFGD